MVGWWTHNRKLILWGSYFFPCWNKFYLINKTEDELNVRLEIAEMTRNTRMLTAVQFLGSIFKSLVTIAGQQVYMKNTNHFGLIIIKLSIKPPEYEVWFYKAKRKKRATSRLNQIKGIYSFDKSNLISNRGIKPRY